MPHVRYPSQCQELSALQFRCVEIQNPKTSQIPCHDNPHIVSEQA